ncbi:MAG TPA: nucleoside-diphosphate kinase [Ignavibacteria bacterium]|mgnify:FL=1|nr:nucleoside-diphosphate kinase [Ignavibacteria bacterium]HRE12258.1 nucleoside-diphosphate kinase [Ignavibacteria bacterium]HRF67567.1 nucleoside-diphosphate kinase [Ignavibacteria bacterium]HRJ05371.1 nucleoside-diphosphate kinase [Ignavibacteria bacterium]HRJ86353.1 nucleoside-diphosphate kinase [Ignavibacteria bacterium]
MKERSLAILKPDCLEKKVQGKVIQHILDAGFEIKGMKLMQLTEDSAKKFYEVHKERPFYGELVAYMTSGPVIPICMEKENAVADFRKLIGATNPANADEGTIRKMYADSIERNIVHGSDSPENAKNEIAHFFNEKDLV